MLGLMRLLIDEPLSPILVQHLAKKDIFFRAAKGADNPGGALLDDRFRECPAEPASRCRRL